MEVQRFDLSHTIEDGMITYKGLPAPEVCDYLTRKDSIPHYSGGTSFHIGKIEMVANTGTYLDAPFHRWADGIDVSQLDLSVLAGLEGLVFRPEPEKRAIKPGVFAGTKLTGKAVLIHTGWDRHWRTDRYFQGHPYLTGESAVYLKEAGAALVGIDSLNIDDTADGTRPVHSTLLRAGIPIVEHMTGLERLPDAGFQFFAVPAKVKGMGTFPVRAFAILGGADV